jgi:hypothetical protein
LQSRFYISLKSVCYDFCLSRKWLCRILIVQDGLQAFLYGATLADGLGELVAVGHLSIMVNDIDQPSAKEIIMAYERGDFALEEDH